MQGNKQIIVIMVLASLLFSAIGAAYYFYNQNQQALKRKNELVTVYIAKEDLKKNTLVEIKHLAQTKIAKQFILNKPLLKNEIIGKYTKEPVFKNEIFIKQKLNTKIQKEKARILPFVNSSYNMKFGLFQNPNYSLLQGDIVKIISVYPKGEPMKGGRYKDFEVEYVATNLKVLGFLRDGRTESDTITRHKIKKVVKKKTVEEVVEIKADELILDIKTDVLLQLVKNYNKGNQLWMVKTKWAKEEIKKPVAIKPVLIAKKDGKKKVTKKAKKKFKKRVYRYTWYLPKNRTIEKSAIIDYANKTKEQKDKGKPKTKNVQILIDIQKECREIRDRLVIGVSENFHIRNEPTTRSSKKSILHRNTIIPYIKKDGNWYQTCDKQYVHKNVVKEISHKEVMKKMSKK